MSAEDKEKYDAMATADKERYKEAMKNYTQPDDSDSSPAKGKKGKQKTKKDPNAPKKATTSFLAYSNDVRSKVKSDHPDASFGELGKKIGGTLFLVGADGSALPECVSPATILF
jgi:hypothetical protein